MPFGQTLLWMALAAASVALLAKAWAMRGGGPAADILHRRGAVIAAALLGATFILLCLLFLVVDVSVLYVWTYTGTWISWPYRLAGAWTGREGSLLMWTAFTAAVVAYYAHRGRDRNVDDPAEKTARAWTDLIMGTLLVVFLIAVVRQGTFTPTDNFLLAGRPQGNGINPTLISPYILIHPPLMFLAYAITIVPAASGIAHMVTGTDRWSVVAGRASRADWVLYTFAMGLGGMWAYYTLGFGGYWAWDPVEVANLLPWLALTLYLHAQMMHARRGWFAGIGPLLAVLPFVLTVFSTVSTRSGLWVSVHAFTDPTNTFNPDAAARLLGILDVDASLLPYFGILLGVLLIALALWCRRLALDHGVMPRSSPIIAAVLAAAGGMTWVAPDLFLSLVFEVGALVGSPGLGALGLLTVAVLAAASPALLATEEKSEASVPGTGWRRFVDVPPLAALAVLLFSLLLVVSLMWHFAAVNGWSESFWDARIPWLMTPVTLALVVLMLRGRGKKQAVIAAGALLAAGLVAFTLGGLPYYAVVMAGGYLLAAADKIKAVGFTGERRVRWRNFLLWVAAIVDLVFWVDPPSFLFGVLPAAWPIHLLMIPLSVVAVVGAHVVGMGRPLRWPFILTALLGGYFVAPVLVLAAWIIGRGRDIPVKAFNLHRVRPIGIYGVHFALAILMLGYATSTYFEVQESTEMDGAQGTFTVNGDAYAGTLSAVPVQGPAEAFTMHLGQSNSTRDGAPASTLQWEPQLGSYRTLPGVLRLWDRDVYVALDEVCIRPLDDQGGCPAGAWVAANQGTGQAFAQGDPSAARFTVWILPGINLVWAGMAFFVLYGLPIASLPDRTAMHSPQPSKPPAKDV